MKRIFYLIIFGAILLSVSCTSTTMITSNPSGAKVYLNGAYVGDTPYPMSDKKISTTCTMVKLEKEGYMPMQTLICRDEDIDVGAAVGGIFFTPIWLWVYKYYPEHHYELLPAEKKQTLDEDNYDFGDYTVDDQAPNQAQTQKSKADKLRELKSLLDDGIITQKEYEKEKKKILEEEEW